MKRYTLLMVTLLGLIVSSSSFARNRAVCRWQAYDSEGFLRGAGHETGSHQSARTLARLECQSRYPGARCSVECDFF